MRSRFSFPTNDGRYSDQLTTLERNSIDVLDIASHQLEVVLIRLTLAELAHSAVVRVQLHDVLSIAWHAEPRALLWHNLQRCVLAHTPAPCHILLTYTVQSAPKGDDVVLQQMMPPVLLHDI
jgi:hypothetical protein